MREARRRQGRSDAGPSLYRRDPTEAATVARGERWQREREWRQSVVEEFGRWLDGFTWSWYATLTFPERIHPEQAGKRWREWTRRMERVAGDDITWARALEWQRRGVVHFHALMYFRRAPPPYAIAHAAWHNVAAGGSWIQRYDVNRGAAGYLGKYLTKGGEVDYGGPWWTPR
jgi:hypothetical protein